MNHHALGTMTRAMKGPIEAPPALGQPLQSIVDVVAAWPGVTATVHWHLVHRSQVDGVDFYLGEAELGHLHVDGSIHLATSPELGSTLVAEGAARPFRYLQGWVEEDARGIGQEAAVALFRRNYDELRSRDIGGMVTLPR